MSIIELLHDITQLPSWYEVKFCSDFTGMIRIEFTNELDKGFYEHEHLGYPDCPLEKLEAEVIRSLTDFLKEHGEVSDGV